MMDRPKAPGVAEVAIASQPTHPPFDLELKTALASLDSQIPPTITSDMSPVLREAVAALRPSDADLSRDGAVDIENVSIPGAEEGSELCVLVCRPARVMARLPAVYWIHGGGMVAGDNRSGMDGVLDWVEQLGMAAISIEYRLAPEHPHPAPIEDCTPVCFGR